MNKIILTKKTSTILLAIVLVGGMIVISSPFSAYAQQQYQQDYESAYYPSDPEMAEDNQPVKIQKANCDNENVNINGVVQAQTQEQTLGSGGFNPGAGDAALTGQDLTPEEAFAAINGNGDPLITAERNILNVCFNDNDNELNGDFTGTQTQTPPTPCDDCFAELSTQARDNINNFLTINGEIQIPGTTILIPGDVDDVLELCVYLNANPITVTEAQLQTIINVFIGLVGGSDNAALAEALVDCLVQAGIITVTIQ